MNNKFLGMLGLAKRAGKVQTGEDICSKAVKSGVSKLIIVACDASDNTKPIHANFIKRNLLRREVRRSLASLQEQTAVR